MRLPVLAGTVATCLTLLAGCVAPPSHMHPGRAVAMGGFEIPVCRRGLTETRRTFIFCPAGRYTEFDIAQAMHRPIDPTLDIASIAAEYGIPRQRVNGIEAATYAGIVERYREARPRSARGWSSVVIIEGRKFRKLALNAMGKAPALLFIEG